MASPGAAGESAAAAAQAGGVIRVRLFAGLREQAGWGERSVPLPPDAAAPTPAELWRRLGLGSGPGAGAAAGPGALPATVRVAVNHAFTGPDDPLRPGDEVAFLPPTSGG